MVIDQGEQQNTPIHNSRKENKKEEKLYALNHSEFHNKLQAHNLQRTNIEHEKSKIYIDNTKERTTQK
jgi:hypothetical protein